jgi:integrase
MGRVVAVFRAAVRDRIVAVSPCVDIRLPRSSSTSAVTEVLEPERVLDLADAVSDRYRALILAHAGLGLRPGGLFALKADRVDFLRRQVQVDQQMVRVRRKGVVATPKLKTRAAYRTLPLPDVVVQVRLGHDSANTTLDIYSKLFPDEEGRARVAIDAVLAASRGDSVGSRAH